MTSVTVADQLTGERRRKWHEVGVSGQPLSGIVGSVG